MSFSYLQETVDHLESKRFSVASTELSELTYTGTRFIVTKPQIQISIEYLKYEEDERYWLHIENYYGLSSMPFEVDSWKFRDTKTEFRFYARNDGTALTFSLNYELIP